MAACEFHAAFGVTGKQDHEDMARIQKAAGSIRRMAGEEE